MRRLRIKTKEGEVLTFNVKIEERVVREGDTTTFYLHNKSSAEEMAQGIRNDAHNREFEVIEDREVKDSVPFVKGLLTYMVCASIITLYSLFRAKLFIEGVKLDFLLDGLVLFLLITVVDFAYFNKYRR